jgi:diguanylate cyclase (GGDEF)-like protein
VDQLDPTSLRFELGIVLVTTLALFYGVTYRTTRSAYVRLWCLALLSLAVGTLLFLGDGTAAQRWTTPVGSAATALGVALVWRAARMLDRRPVPRWRILVAPLVVLVASALDSPATDVWAGAWLLFPMVSLLIGLAAAAMWTSRPGDAGRLRRATSLAGWSMSAYYLARTMALLAWGGDDERFTTVFGTVPTTVVLTVMLVSASFSMSALTNELEADVLRHAASHDPLTGLLNRAGLDQRAGTMLRGLRQSVVVMADLDHFKQVNDTYGHQVGDQVLVAFAAACRDTLRSTDLVVRYGGEELVLVLPGASATAARAAAAAVRERLLESARSGGLPAVTASFGVAQVAPDESFDHALRRADAALYRAKAAGRDRVVVDGTD